MPANVRGQSSCQRPLYVLAAQDAPQLGEIEWYISELWADVRLCPSPKRAQ